jgi:hypothetical protein
MTIASFAEKSARPSAHGELSSKGGGSAFASMALSAQRPAPERATTKTAVRVARVDRNAMVASWFKLLREPGISRAVFPVNIVIVAEDDKTRVARAAEMFGYKFLLASSRANA